MDHKFVTGLIYYFEFCISFLSVQELVCIELQGCEASANCPLLDKIWSMLQIWAPSSRRSSREKHNVGHGVYLGREHIRLHAVARLNYRTKTQSAPIPNRTGAVRGIWSAFKERGHGGIQLN